MRHTCCAWVSPRVQSLESPWNPGHLAPHEGTGSDPPPHPRALSASSERLPFLPRALDPLLPPHPSLCSQLSRKFPSLFSRRTVNWAVTGSNTPRGQGKINGSEVSDAGSGHAINPQVTLRETQTHRRHQWFLARFPLLQNKDN